MDRNALPAKLAGEILELISMGEIAPDTHLSTQKLANRFQVSRTPIREALGVLAQEGVVEQRPNRGYFVRDLPSRARARIERTLAPAGEEPELYYRLAEDWVRDAIPVEVTEQSLRSRYAVTRGQLGEVLSRAEQEGWAVRKAGYGWRLLPVAKTPEALEQIYRFRIVIEPAALLEPGFRLDRAAADRLHAVQRSILDSDIERWPAARLLGAGVEFHEALLRMSGNPFFEQALGRVNRFRRLLEYRSAHDFERYRIQARQHLEILERVSAGDMVEAAFQMRRHLSEAIARKAPIHRLLQAAASPVPVRGGLK